MVATTCQPTLALTTRLLSRIRPPKLRTLREFAEQELILPTGPFSIQRYRIYRQPADGLLFDEIDSGRWERIAVSGPRQSGKSLKGFVIPTLYHLFEQVETVILGTPTGEMAADKWNRDLLPAIRATRYRNLLPYHGAGSRGGKFETIEFGNGATLKFMTGGGSDKSRAGFTSRIVAVTETDGMDEAGRKSREADKISQMEACTKSFADRARIYLECTVSIEKGRIWQEIKNGSDSRIAILCPHCGEYVTPEREHLTGWQNAEDAIGAGENTRLACPACGVPWTEGERVKANVACRLVHKGQAIDREGNISGPLPRTNTLGFRYTAVNNMLVPLHVLGRQEWAASRAADEENADKEQRQYVWVLPAKSTAVDLTEFDASAITRRTTSDMKGRVPSWCRRITIGVDIGKWLCHWTAIAWGEHATPHILEYGRLEVPSKEMAEELAIVLALRKFRDEIVATGWPADGGPMKPEIIFVDVGYKQDTVREFIGESGRMFWGVKGFARLNDESSKQGGKMIGKGQDSILVDLGDGKVPIIQVQANAWKSWTHARLQTPMGQPGAMTLHSAKASVEHLGFAKHMTAERKVEEFVAGKGLVTEWEALNRNNHWLDATCMAAVAGWWVGERLLGFLPVPAEKPKQVAADRPDWMPDRPAEWMR